MVKQKTIIKLVVVATVAAVLLWCLLPWLRHVLEVDSCLDHGGRWDDEQGECKFVSAASRPFASR